MKSAALQATRRPVRLCALRRLRNLPRLESRLAKKVNETAQMMTPSNPREPLEIVHAIVETSGRGR